MADEPGVGKLRLNHLSKNYKSKEKFVKYCICKIPNFYHDGDLVKCLICGKPPKYP